MAQTKSPTSEYVTLVEELFTNGRGRAVPLPLQGKEASTMGAPIGADEREVQPVEAKGISMDEGEPSPPAASGTLTGSSNAVRFYTEALQEIARKHGVGT